MILIKTCDMDMSTSGRGGPGCIDHLERNDQMTVEQKKARSWHPFRTPILGDGR